MKNKPFKVECKGGNTNSSNKVTIYNEGKDEKATNQYDPLVPSQKEKERHLTRFLDIFKKLEITLPFGEAFTVTELWWKAIVVL